ncbi:neutral zinc metallopeptidase [Hydrogenimonas sp. SS33]|uniref:KPN_02809 family neutral zinc metallopeptidase n=1 Tax=Hydrogenimonas leucolamina TaxID=2954236 RepID=UPI00336C067C
MRLDDMRESENVEDRRFQTGGFGGRAGGVLRLLPLVRSLLRTKFGWLIIAAGVVAYMKGYDPLALLQGSPAATEKRVPAREDHGARFIKRVLASTEDVWSRLLPKYGKRYTKPTLVLFRGSTQSGCGYASAQTGPFYCPADRKVYLDLGFFDQLANRHDAPGDFAQAYVLAHEIGHHVQNIFGTLEKVHRAQKNALQIGDKTTANHLQIPVELQADCYAGIWAHYNQNRLDPGDVEEAITAASHIGDDTLQKEARGYVVPDSFTHGTSKQRVTWFLRGFKSGKPEACNTFRLPRTAIFNR